jgi:hypothetical protein
MITILFTFGHEQAFHYFFGSIVVIANIGLYIVLFNRIRAKKSVAWCVAGIVFKYAILAWTLSELAKFGTQHFVWIVAGVATLVPSSLVSTLVKVKD